MLTAVVKKVLSRVTCFVKEKKKQNDRERGVGSGWRRGGMVEDINVCEDRKGYCLVAVVSDYLLVHFFLSKDGESMEKKGVQ